VRQLRVRQLRVRQLRVRQLRVRQLRVRQLRVRQLQGMALGPRSEPVAPDVAADLVARLTSSGRTVAVAESLTGGLVAAALTGVAGASAVVRGGVLAYATDLKAQVLGVDEALLARVGAVDADVAEQMARGVRSLMGATYGLATTGVAGPDQADGKAVGTVYVAVAGPVAARVRALSLSGDRGEVRAQSVLAVLALLAEEIEVEQLGSEVGEDPPLAQR
jgi:nicotinamide-nucleotide amidase